MKLYTFFSDFFGLFYPRLCAGCGEMLFKNERVLCTKCLINLPRTNYHLDSENDTARIFWGRARIENASSYLFFKKGGIVQKLLHRLKYKGDKAIGEFLGKIAAYELINTQFSMVDIIVPVPLHRKRKIKRGYNQSEMIAAGIAEVFKKPVITNILARNRENISQTTKHRYDRWLNVKEIFEVTEPDLIRNNHILLVDDVITTGATIESCVEALLKYENVKVSVFTIAKA